MNVLLTKPLALLRIEAIALLAASLVLYQDRGAGWLIFAILFLVPDLTMVGYLAGPRLGAAAYNAAHTTVLPLAALTAGLVLERQTLTGVGLIWLAHIGMDRTLGYGLKFPTRFKATHLSPARA
jgi:hypothetical protein